MLVLELVPSVAGGAGGAAVSVGGKLPVRIIRNKYRPMSVVEKAFVEVLDLIWEAKLVFH